METYAPEGGGRSPIGARFGSVVGRRPPPFRVCLCTCVPGNFVQCGARTASARSGAGPGRQSAAAHGLGSCRGATEPQLTAFARTDVETKKITKSLRGLSLIFCIAHTHTHTQPSPLTGSAWSGHVVLPLTVRPTRRRTEPRLCRSNLHRPPLALARSIRAATLRRHGAGRGAPVFSAPSPDPTPLRGRVSRPVGGPAAARALAPSLPHSHSWPQLSTPNSTATGSAAPGDRARRHLHGGTCMCRGGGRGTRQRRRRFPLAG